jgi:hypothetical protein
MVIVLLKTGSVIVRFLEWDFPPKLSSLNKTKDLAEAKDASSAATKIVSCMMDRRMIKPFGNKPIGACVFEERMLLMRRGSSLIGSYAGRTWIE